jgi:chromosome segregation ATPase
MDVFNRLSVAIVCLVGAAVICAVAWLAGRYYENSAAFAWVEAETSSDGEPPVESAGGEPAANVHVDHLFAQRAQIQRLEALLNQKTELLEKKNQLLEEKTREQASLEADITDSLTMLEVMTATLFELTGPPQETEETDLGEELTRLKDERSQKAELAKRLQDELDQLKLDLAGTDEEITQLRVASELEVGALEQEMQAFRTAASEILATVGAAAVPPLIQRLADPRASIRQWAAAVLGQIGPDARQATAELAELLTDRDPLVRQAARQALDRIQPMGR